MAGPSCRIGAVILVVSSAAFVPPAVLAQLNLHSWDIEPGVRLQLLYDDNVRFSIDDPQSSFGGIAEAYANLSRRTEVSDLTLRAAVVQLYYTDATELDSTDGSAEAAFAYRMERSEAGLVSRFVYDTTLTSEAEAETSGIVELNKRRNFFEISPYWEYSLTERARVGADVMLQEVSYEDVSEILLSNYRFGRVGLSGEYDFTERTALVGRLNYDRYDSEQADDNSETFGVEAGLRYRFSERTTIRALAGARSATSTTGDATDSGDDRSTGPIFEFGFEQDYEVGSIDMTLERSLLPSGRGSLLDTTRAVVQITRPLSERLAARLRAIGVRNRNPDGEVSFNDRDFLLVSPGLRWRLAESTWLDLSYRYRWQDRELTSGDAVSNAVFFGIGHDWAAR